MNDDDEDDELREIHRAARSVLDTVHAITDRVLPPENARAMLIGIAAIMLSRNVRDGHEPDAATINAIWAQENFPWRMVRAALQ